MNNLIQMNDFNSDFWSWFIIILTLGGILYITLIAVLNSKSAPKEKSSEGTQPETMGHVWDGDLEEFNNPLPRWWLNMLYITIVFGVIYLVLFPGLGTFPGLLDWTQRGQYEKDIAKFDETHAQLYDGYASKSIEELASDSAAKRTAQNLFTTNCAQCHSTDARGATNYPNLRDKDWLYGDSAEVILASITNGRNGVMPAWGDPLGEEGVNATTEYVLSFTGRATDDALVTQGEQMYATFCLACHGADGSGNQALGAPNLTDDIWLYGSNVDNIKESIRAGRNGNMPAQQELLSEVQIKLLASYIYGFAQNPE